MSSVLNSLTGRRAQGMGGGAWRQRAGDHGYAARAREPTQRAQSERTESDGTLAGLALGGDNTSFEALMSRHQGRTYKLIRRYVGNSADACDVLQDTFLSAWRGLSAYERDRPLEFWLGRIALNKCRDRNRRDTARRFVNSGLRVEEIPELRDSAPTPPDAIEADQELARLESCMLRLADPLRASLSLTAIEGLSHKEAARVLGVSAKAIEMRVYRARTRLAELLDEGCADT